MDFYLKFFIMGGYEMLVHAEVLRGRYRKSLENPEPFVPGKIERVKFNVGDIDKWFSGLA